jgi:signal transduction histidine kinase
VSEEVFSFRLLALRSSLRLRLLLGTLVWIVVSTLAAGWALDGLFRNHVTEQFQAGLRLHLDYLATHLAVGAEGKSVLSVVPTDPRFDKPYSGLYWQVEQFGQAAGMARQVLRSRSLWDSVLSSEQSVPADGEVHRHFLSGPDGRRLVALERVVRLADEDGRPAEVYLLTVAANEQQLAEPIENFAGMLWFALGLLGLGLAVVAVVQVSIALIPLRRLHHGLSDVRDARTQTLAGDFPGEVQPLVEAFNSVLVQNSEIVERARTQAGNLAHALKTPLSVISNAANGISGDAAQLIRGQVELARRQIDYQLSRSRAAASLRVPGVHSAVLPVLESLIRVMQRIYHERGLSIQIRAGAAPVVFRGEEQDLQEMLGNLLDNACKWAAKRIEVSVSGDAQCLLLTVDDDGPGISMDARSRVLNRGERIDEQVPGSGLGLAIVDDLSRLYGGRLELADSPLGGLRVALSLPATGLDDDFAQGVD